MKIQGSLSNVFVLLTEFFDFPLCENIIFIRKFYIAMHCVNIMFASKKMMMEQSHKLGAKLYQIMQESISDRCVMDSIILFCSLTLATAA